MKLKYLRKKKRELLPCDDVGSQKNVNNCGGKRYENWGNLDHMTDDE